MYKTLLYTYFFAIAFSSASLAAGAALQVLPHVPVEQNSHLELAIAQSIPGLPLDIRSDQSMLYEVTVQSNHADRPLTRLPVDLSFTLKHIKVNISSDEESAVFDSDNPKSSLSLVQVSRMIDRPIHLRMNEHLRVAEEASDLRDLSKEFPALVEFNPQLFFQELFYHQFALLGQDLEVGKDIVLNEKNDFLGKHPIKMVYTITHVDTEKVRADIHGQFASQSVKLNTLMGSGQSTKHGLTMSLSGTIKGKGEWDIKNALFHDIDLTYHYEGIISILAWDWVVKLDIHLVETSHGMESS